MSDVREFDALFARLDDLCHRAERGEVAVSVFLSPRELHFAAAYLRRSGAHFFAFGGYDGAERQRIYILPDYMESAEDVQGLDDFGVSHGISAVRVLPSGYRKLSHRDFLGSVLGLGIERSVIGDILVDDGSRAVIFCDTAMQDFLASELCKVANDKVRTQTAELSAIALPERRYAQINDTVASPRLDCIVGSLCSLSRERAKEAVVAGLVEIDFETEERPDRVVEAPALVSVRGYGRYRVLSVSDLTKKGRYRLAAEKFL